MLSRSAVVKSVERTKTPPNGVLRQAPNLCEAVAPILSVLGFDPFSANLPVDSCAQTTKLSSGWSCSQEIVFLMVASKVGIMASVAAEPVFKIFGMRFAYGLNSI